jgi:hypothetical protein
MCGLAREVGVPIVPIASVGGHTKVIFRPAYESAGNLLGLIADRVAARQVARNMTETLKNLKRMVEP